MQQKIKTGDGIRVKKAGDPWITCFLINEILALFR